MVRFYSALEPTRIAKKMDVDRARMDERAKLPRRRVEQNLEECGSNVWQRQSDGPNGKEWLKRDGTSDWRNGYESGPDLGAPAPSPSLDMQPSLAFHNQLVRPSIAELLASIVFSFLSGFAGRIPLDQLHYAIASGISLLSAQIIVQRISGAHLNTAVSLAHLIHGRLSGVQCFCYICVQLFGAFIGSSTHFLLVSSAVFEDSFLPHEIVKENGQGRLTRLQGFLLEAALVTIFCVAHLRQDSEPYDQPAVVPSVWALISYICVPLIGPSCNVALSISSTVVHSIFLARAPVPSSFYLPPLASLLGAFLSSLITYSCREVTPLTSPCEVVS